ncbi:hypothetical protein D3C84_753260 [compost metagenome]
MHTNGAGHGPVRLTGISVCIDIEYLAGGGVDQLQRVHFDQTAGVAAAVGAVVEQQQGHCADAALEELAAAGARIDRVGTADGAFEGPPAHLRRQLHRCSRVIGEGTCVRVADRIAGTVISHHAGIYIALPRHLTQLDAHGVGPGRIDGDFFQGGQHAAVAAHGERPAVTAASRRQLDALGVLNGLGKPAVGVVFVFGNSTQPVDHIALTAHRVVNELSAPVTAIRAQQRLQVFGA